MCRDKLFTGQLNGPDQLFYLIVSPLSETPSLAPETKGGEREYQGENSDRVIKRPDEKHFNWRQQKAADDATTAWMFAGISLLFGGLALGVQKNGHSGIFAVLGTLSFFFLWGAVLSASGGL